MDRDLRKNSVPWKVQIRLHQMSLWTRNSRFWTRTLFAMLTALGALGTRGALAQNVADVDSQAESAAEEDAPLTLDLGRFSIKELRPTRNETLETTFAIHLKISPAGSKDLVEQLELWKHRLRSQVIVAARTAETTEFREPDLHRLRRRMLLRVNRMLKNSIISEILLSEFTFSVK